MEDYIIELSKYFIAVFIAIYAFECFAVYRFPTEEKRHGIYLRQIILLFFIHFSCSLMIYLKKDDIQYLFLYAFEQIAIFTFLALFQMIYPLCNRLLINNICFLTVISYVILTRLDMKKAVKQFIIVSVSMVVSLVVPYVISEFKLLLKKLEYAYAIVGIAALGFVLLLGQFTNGAKLSYAIGGLTFQPSEFIKIIFVFYLAAVLSKAHDFLTVLKTALFAGAQILILVLSKDLGSALIFFVVYVLTVYMATGMKRYLLAGLSGGVIASIVSYQIFPHIQVRIKAYMDPWSVIDGQGYQITQSLFALGGGNLFGLGLFGGTPEDIPYVETDFIFSAITEEMGLIFSMCMILICLSCFIMIMDISIRMKDRFFKIVSFGLGATYIFQVFLTIGGDTKFIPLTGVTLPFISYGGSSVLSTMIMFAVIEGIYITKQKELKESVPQKINRRKTEYEKE